jgi:hypothetical protein
MNFRFTLTHDILGSHEINEPDGWKDCKIKLERHKDFRSLLEYFDGDFIFYGSNGVVDGGLDFIKEVEQAYGVDATIQILIEVSFDGYTYDDLFEGQLNLSGIQEVQDNKAQIPIIRDDFWAKFINRLETPVDLQSPLSLDSEASDIFDSINIRLSSQKIQKQYYGVYDDGDRMVQGSLVDAYLQTTPNNVKLDEIQDAFNLISAYNPVIPVNFIEVVESGSYVIQVQLCISDINSGAGESVGYSAQWDWYIRINDTDYPLVNSGTIGAYPSGYVKYTFLQTFDLKVGDLITLYADEVANLATVWVIIGINGSVYNSAGDQKPNITDQEIPSFIRITAQTVVPETNSFGFFLHDAAGQIADRIISRDESFYSEYLGSGNTIYRQYDADGCAWKYALLKGLQIRQYSLIEKPFFLSFKQWWEGANPILCLGLGYETINGVQVIRVEKMEDFYDASETSLDISNVSQITRLYDQEVIFKTVKVGYKKWQSEDISGLDDPQTKHTYATRFQKVGKEFTIESDFIAASLAIETTRRKTREKSADYKFDDETFIIALNPIPVDISPETSPEVTDYSPELDENFTSVDNLLNSDTRYNLRLTPARNLIRWIRYISGALQSYLSSTFKFTSGEGNYDMVSDMSNVSDGCDEFKPSLAENEDIPVSADPLHLALAYEIVIPLEWEDYLLIRENRKKAIGISQTTVNHAKFFIDTLEYELAKGVATIKAWPVTYFDVQVIESETFMRDCQAVITEVCEDAYLTENSFELITEDGDCLILE